MDAIKKVAKERGIKLYAMTNTGGRTWDLGTCPYFPFPNQWAKRFDEVNKARKNFGLTGLMESHHYGFVPSFISRLTQLCYQFDDKIEENI